MQIRRHWRRLVARLIHAATCAACVMGVSTPGFAQLSLDSLSTGEEVYKAACATCHGPDGRGGPSEALAFLTPVPDFSDCEFGPREPDAQWIAIVHGGGPARAFNRMMPSFRDALSLEQIQVAVSHVRTFCTDRAWPHGDLNFPKALVTEKAFPEDEVVITTTAAVDGPGAVTTRTVYERRIGARTQVEFGVPIRAQRQPAGEAAADRWVSGVGDVAFALKRVLAHNLERGHILSATAEVVTPTGSEAKGLGSGTATFEPFLTYGQLLPAGVFVQSQGGVGLPFDSAVAKEVFWRVTVGRSFNPVPRGRMWSPMIEILGARELARGEPALWDLLPEMQVTLSRRQHVRISAGVRVPINDSSTRSTQVLTYLLWDWYEGSFFSGW